MTFTIIKIIHMFSVFIYGGFLITDNLFLNKMPRNLDEDEHKKARESFMMFVRKVVPPSLLVSKWTLSHITSFWPYCSRGHEYISDYTIYQSISRCMARAQRRSSSLFWDTAICIQKSYTSICASSYDYLFDTDYVYLEA